MFKIDIIGVLTALWPLKKCLKTRYKADYFYILVEFYLGMRFKSKMNWRICGPYSNEKCPTIIVQQTRRRKILCHFVHNFKIEKNSDRFQYFFLIYGK